VFDVGRRFRLGLGPGDGTERRAATEGGRRRESEDTEAGGRVHDATS
jgi:hypothetical protein